MTRLRPAVVIVAVASLLAWAASDRLAPISDWLTARTLTTATATERDDVVLIELESDAQAAALAPVVTSAEPRHVLDGTRDGLMAAVPAIGPLHVAAHRGPAGTVDGIELDDPSWLGLRARGLAPPRVLRPPLRHAITDVAAAKAAHFISGALPPEALAGRTVIIADAAQAERQHATWAGWRRESMLVADSVAALVRGDLRKPAPWWVSLTLLALAAGLGHLAGGWSSSRRRSGVAVGVALLVALGAALALIALTGWVVPVAAAGVALLLAAALTIAGQRATLSQAMRALHQDALGRLDRHRASTPWSARPVLLDRAWDQLRCVVDDDGGLFFALPTGQWHLRLEQAWDRSEAEVIERRRDARRDPWRIAYATRRPGLSKRPMFVGDEQGIRTLIVPVTAQATLLGYFVLALRAPQAVTDAELAAIETIADQVAAELTAGEAVLAPLPGGALPATLAEVRRATGAAHRLTEASPDIIEALPVGVYVASLGGRVLHCNGAMRAWLGQVGIADPYALGAAEVLTSATGLDADHARRVIRAAVVERAAQALLPAGGLVGHRVTCARIDSAQGEAWLAILVVPPGLLSSEDDPRLEADGDGEGAIAALGRAG